MSEVKEISFVQAEELLVNSNGKFFGARFVRKHPKCKTCGKTTVKNGVCKCGSTNISYERTTAGRLGVKNPKSSATVPGQGAFVGEGFEEAIAKGRIKYYDPNVINKDNSHGNYRQFYIDSLIELSINKERFAIHK